MPWLKKKDLFEERVYVHEVCLLGRPVYMNYTLPTSIYTEELIDLGLGLAAGNLDENDIQQWIKAHR